MDENQWKDFLEKAIDILFPEDKENITPESTITKYLYNTEHQSPKSFFSKTSFEGLRRTRRMALHYYWDKGSYPRQTETPQTR